MSVAWASPPVAGRLSAEPPASLATRELLRQRLFAQRALTRQQRHVLIIAAGQVTESGRVRLPTGEWARLANCAPHTVRAARRAGEVLGILTVRRLVRPDLRHGGLVCWFDASWMEEANQ
jgi:hypothetical protein